jgi:hypothetical protein
MTERGSAVAGYLGPYGRVAYGFIVEKTHYTLEQRGAWLTAWCMAGLRPGRDGSVKLKPLRSAVGEALLDFLLEEGDLVRTGDPELLMFRNFEWANEPMERNRRNVAAYRDRQRSGGNGVDSSPSPDSNLTRDVLSQSQSVSTSGTKNGENPVAPAHEADDPIWIFYMTTNEYPNTPKMKRWITDTASRGPSARDFGVVFPGEWTASGYKADVALRSTAAKLSAMTDRADAAKAAEPKPVDPLIAEIGASLRSSGHYEDTGPAVDLEAGRKLRESFGNGNGKGLAAAAAAVIGSPRGDRAVPSTTRQDAGTSDSPTPARTVPPISGGDDAVRPAASRSPNEKAPTDGASQEIR